LKSVSIKFFFYLAHVVVKNRLFSGVKNKKMGRGWTDEGLFLDDSRIMDFALG
jgi:hypothetical protein